MKSTDDCTLLAWGYNEPLLGAPVSEIPFLCCCCRCDYYSHLPSCAYADVPTGGGVLIKGRLQRDLGGHNAGGWPRSLFATSPQDFRFAGDLEPCGIPGHKRPAFAMSQRGLEMSLPIVKDESHDHIVYGLLACSPPFETRQTELVAIPLIRSSVIDAASKDHEDEYVQSPFCLPCKVPVSFSAEAERMSICIRNEDRYRRLWDSVGYLKRPLIFDFGHPLATKKEGSTLRLELMYPSQPLSSVYFTLLRDSCPSNATSCSAFSIWPSGAGSWKPDWWSHHITGPLPPHRVLPGDAHPWDKIIHNSVQYTPNTTIAAAVLNFDPYPLQPKRTSQTRILLVVSFDHSCRVMNLGPDEEVTLRSLMSISSQPELAGFKLHPKHSGIENHERWREASVVYRLPDGIELCLRRWC